MATVVRSAREEMMGDVFEWDPAWDKEEALSRCSNGSP